MIKTKKRKKSSRDHGKGMGTSGWGARKKHKKSGHRGGKGMSGSGKRADHKKTLVTKKFGHGYFGKKGFTSKGSQKDKRQRINVGDIQNKYQPGEIDLPKYKILGGGIVKSKFVVKAAEASKSAIDKIKKVGGEIILPAKKSGKAKKEIVDAPKGAEKASN